jgi:predicted dehydrogenase
VKVAVLGLGSAGRRHVRCLAELGHTVVGFDPGKVDAPDGMTRVGSPEEAIAAAEAVVVASPSSHHAEHATAALRAGKHVLAEKPLAVDVAAAERVVAAAEHAGVVCGVAMNLRFHPGVLELKRLLDEGALGDIRLARASFGYDLRLWRPGTDYRQGYSARAELGGGIVLDAIHELDYLLWLLGPVESVSGEIGRLSDLEIDVEDVAVALLRFKGRALASVDLNFFEPAYRRGCLLVGAEAVAQWDWQRATVTVSREDEPDRLADAACDLTETYRAELLDFLDAVEREADPRTSFREGLEAVRVAAAIKRSAAEGARVALPG